MKKVLRVGEKGNQSIIMLGVTIGANFIIGACSCANVDIPYNVGAIGVPEKIIKVNLMLLYNTENAKKAGVSGRKEIG